MRVLHVSGGQVYGGIERMLATFASARSNALTQQFAVFPEKRLWCELRDAGARSVILSPARASRPLSVLTARRAFARQLVQLQPDAAIFHGSWTHAMFAPAARASGAVVAFWQHAPVQTRQWPERWAARTRPDVLIANSRFTASAPAFVSSRTHVIYCPVAPARRVASQDRRSLRAGFGICDTEVVVLMAARLEAWKGHRVLIEAARMLDSRNMKIWIAGGPQRPEERAYFADLEAHVSAAGASSIVRLLGERGDVQSLMELADIYCQPNIAPEPFGMAIAEAMRAQLPCVVSNCGGTAELVDPTCGILTDPGDACTVAAALAYLAGNAGLRQTMGRAASERASLLTDPAAKLNDLAAVLAMPRVHA